MTLPSLFEDCQALIEREQESWKSYFSKWEVLGKYEEDIPENSLISESKVSVKPAGKKKKKTMSQTKKRKSLSLLTQKKNIRNKKKIIRRKKSFSKSIPSAELVQHYSGHNEKNEENFTENAMLETNLKKFFRDFLRENKNKIEIFGVLSLTFLDCQKTDFNNLFFSNEQILPCHDFQLNKRTLSCVGQQNVFSEISKMILNNKLVNPVRNTYIENFRGILNSECYVQPIAEDRKWEWIRNHSLVDRYSRSAFCIKNNINHRDCTHIMPKMTTQANLGSTSNYPFFLRNSFQESSELKPLDWSFRHKSPVSICRKINKEYFIKRTFSKMNITQDVERFRNLCLHKRTNSVSLGMENSNFTTPERKPSERKCFSENVLQRKRRCLSKLFFDNEEDSESDDQIENRAPLIRCKSKKLKSQIMTENLESDSDEYESIFDRVKKS